MSTFPVPESGGVDRGGVKGMDPQSEEYRDFFFPEFTRLGHKMRCPHCECRLTLKQAIFILNGSGFVQMARVRLRNGALAVMDAALVNPNAVEIVDD
jgi:hypothetical protein